MEKEDRRFKLLLKKYISQQKRIKELEEIIRQVQNIPEKKEYLTKKEVSEEFNISERTLDRYRVEGLKYIQKTRNGKVLFHRKDIEEYLKSKTP